MFPNAINHRVARTEAQGTGPGTLGHQGRNAAERTGVRKCH